MTSSYYDEDAEKVRRVGTDLNNKWNYLARKLDPLPLNNKIQTQMIQVWHDEAINRFADAGFVVEVDVTPALAGLAPPVVSVVGKTEVSAFDYDKKAHEIKTSREQGGI